MLGKSLAILVVSPHERSGTTLIARLFADFFRIAGQAPLLFDTDVQHPKFSKYFPDAQLVDLGTTKGRMNLFDTLPVRTLQPKIVDVTHRAYSDFFTLVRDIDLIAELSRQGGWIMISGDRRITRNKAEKQAFQNSRIIGMFLSPGLYKAPVLKQAERLIALWPSIEKVAGSVTGGSMFELPMTSLKISSLK